MATTGVAALPTIGSKSAPKKFTGKYTEVKPFVQHYERLCVRLSIDQDHDRIENITQYCSRKVRQFLESLLSYAAVPASWAAFKSDILKYFDADRDDKRYKVKNLETYVKDSRQKSTVKSLGVWREYTRGFLTISGWLKNNERITADEQALYFWKGIPRSFRQILEPRLLAANPMHDLSKPFDMSEITKTAEAILQRNRFDADRLPSDDEDESESDSDSSDNEVGSESDSSSDSDDECSHKCKVSKDKKRKKVKSSKKSRSKRTTPEDSDEEDIKRVQAAKKRAVKEERRKADEVEELVRQMNCMSLSGPDYGVIYL